MLTGLKIMQNLLKYPWISLCSPGNHKAVTSRLFLHGNHILRRQQISVSNHGNGYRLFYLTDNVPVCLSGIKLFSCAAMHSHCCRSRILCNLCHLHCIHMIVIESLSDFYSYRFVDCLYCLSDNLPCQFRVLHQRRSLTVIHNFRHRTSHINIQQIKRTFLDFMRYIRNYIRI